MKCLALLTALVCLVGCSPISANNVAAESKTYDMLAWMTMSPGLRADHHMASSANPVYTKVLRDRFVWTKTAHGFPWDIQLYDDNYIYLWVTELDWQNPNSFKVFNSPQHGKFNLPLAPRFAHGGYPGSTIKISDSAYEIHSDCNSFTTHQIGHVINEVWGPYKENLGGGLPADLKTLVISYRYNCDAQYSNCRDKEEYHLAQPYGLVKWQHERLGPDGTYAPPDKVTVINKLMQGQVEPFSTCF